MLFLKDYASYIKDNMVTELTDFNRNLMFSIDIVPVPTDEAVREVENRLLVLSLFDAVANLSNGNLGIFVTI